MCTESTKEMYVSAQECTAKHGLCKQDLGEVVAHPDGLVDNEQDKEVVEGHIQTVEQELVNSQAGALRQDKNTCSLEASNSLWLSSVAREQLVPNVFR